MTNNYTDQGAPPAGATWPPTPTGRQWLSNADLANRYGVSIDTVRKWRHEGTGPQGVRFGRHVRYALAELERWEQEQAAKQARVPA